MLSSLNDSVRYVGFVVLFLAVVISASACSVETLSSTGSSNSKTSDLSTIALTPDQSWHDSYLVGSHASFSCDNCHSASVASNEAICVSCHNTDYNNTSTPNHAQYNTGTRCNACHYSDSFTSHTRVSHTKFHETIEGSCISCHSGKKPSSHVGNRDSGCESCHSYPDWSDASSSHNYSSGCVNCHSGKKPSSHTGNRDSGCESCHSYPDWSTTTGFSHTGVTSGCNVSGCHTRHYDAYDCVWCHTSANPGVYWGGWSHSRTDSRACTACHANGYDDDDDDDDHDDDDDDYDDD